MVRSIQPASKWKILVTDSNSKAIIDSLCKGYEVLDENVTSTSLMLFIIFSD